MAPEPHPPGLSEGIPPRDRLLAEATPALVWTTDRDGKVTYFNRRRYDYTGQDEAEALGDGWALALHPEDRAASLEHWRRALDGLEPYEVEYRLRRYDGQYRWFLTRGAPIGGEAGLEGWVGSCTDVHVGRRAAEHSARLQAVTEALSSALTPDEVTNVIVRQGLAATGAAAGGVMLRSEDGGAFEIVRSVGYPPEVVAAFRRVPADSPLPAVVAAREGEAVWVEELEPAAAHDPVIAEARRRSGNRSAAIVPLVNGSVLGAITLSFAERQGFDAQTRGFMLALGRLCGQSLHRARLLAEVQALNASLERRVEERTRELEARNAEQEAFIYTVSHDLRAPLLSMRGMAELFAEAVRSGDVDEADFLASRVAANVERMGALLSDLLTLSRVGQAGEAAGPLDLGEAVRATLAELEPRLSARGVRVELPASWPRVLCPPTEAGQLASNLLGNASKWAGRHGEVPRVAVSWREEEGLVVLQVSDNGPGIPPEHRERVFGLFQRLDATTEGTGVGLAIVRRIVERHGGRAWVVDSPPPPEGLGGATFAVSLPLA